MLVYVLEFNKAEKQNVLIQIFFLSYYDEV